MASPLEFKDVSTPVLVVNCKLGALAIMRSLGRLGVPLYGVDADPRSPAMLSRYCRERFLFSPDESRPMDSPTGLRVGRRLGRRAILIPTSMRRRSSPSIMPRRSVSGSSFRGMTLR